MRTGLEHEVPLMPTDSPPPLYLCWHRVMDITFGLLGMVILLLILPIVALLIYLDSPGPIFYTQERVGYQGRKFFMRKFRSMCRDAEHAHHAVWASKGDPRVTRVGRILRATHLDELPQALNILRSEMSLIGPRPEQPHFASELEKADPLYRCRLAVKPGLTGWAQVNYGYGSTSQDELIKLQYDLYYINHQSFKLDVVILMKTVAEVVLRHGQ
jgi:lipopolysaccharide/colanic/teichoic acid biosynthesis glycosyltransferase